MKGLLGITATVAALSLATPAAAVYQIHTSGTFATGANTLLSGPVTFDADFDVTYAIDYWNEAGHWYGNLSNYEINGSPSTASKYFEGYQWKKGTSLQLSLTGRYAADPLLQVTVNLSFHTASVPPEAHPQMPANTSYYLTQIDYANSKLNIWKSPTEFAVVTGLTDFDFSISGIGPKVVHGTVPEPASWALMLTGFAAVGYSLRRRRVAVAIGA